MDHKLDKIKFKSLSRTEKDNVWQNINSNLNKTSFFILLLTRKSMINIIVAVLVILSGSIATVRAADNAKPGDVLYGIDRAVENIQITFASQEKKDKLKIKFAQERVEEIQTIIEESIKNSQTLKEVEVKIYNDKSIVKAESENDKHFKFFLDSTDQVEITKLIADRFKTTLEDIESIIKFEVKNEKLDDEDDSKIKIEGDEEIEESTQVALNYIIKVRNELLDGGNKIGVENLDLLIEQLKNKLEILPEGMKVDLEIDKSDNKTKFELELKGEDNKLKIK